MPHKKNEASGKAGPGVPCDGERQPCREMPTQKQGRRALVRTIHLRRHGDGYKVLVEPHPAITGNKPSLNRRLDTYPQAMAYALGLQGARGYPIADEARGGRDAGHSDPARNLGPSTIFVAERACDTFAVTISPRPWACEEGLREFRDLG